MAKPKTKIDMTERILNSANKENKSMDHIRTGTGAHRSKKDYRRKQKHEKNYKYYDD